MGLDLDEEAGLVAELGAAAMESRQEEAVAPVVAPSEPRQRIAHSNYLQRGQR